MIPAWKLTNIVIFALFEIHFLFFELLKQSSKTKYETFHSSSIYQSRNTVKYQVQAETFTICYLPSEPLNEPPWESRTRPVDSIFLDNVEHKDTDNISTGVTETYVVTVLLLISCILSYFNKFCFKKYSSL